MRRLNSSVKCCTSKGTSSGRSRSGGTQDRKDIQAIEEIGTKGLIVYHLRKIAVGGGDETRIGAHGSRASEPFEFALLQDAQQFRLEFERNLADLVEKDGPPVGEFEAPNALREGSGEGAPLMTEELAFKQAGWNGGAVQFDERAVATRTQVVDGARDQFLARAGFAVNEDRRIRWARQFPPASTRCAVTALLPTISSNIEVSSISCRRATFSW